MTDRDAFRRAILADPDADLPRLVWADWLDENGDGDRAGYVRAHVELARLVAIGAFDADAYVAAVRAVSVVTADELWAWARADGVPVTPGSLLGRDSFGAEDTVRDVVADLAFKYRRGLVEVVRCRAAFWTEHGPRVMAAAPVGRVEWTDRKPYSARRGEWAWRLPEGYPGDFSNVVPRAVFDRLPGDRSDGAAVYRTRADAVAALSAACLAFARAAG